MQYSFLLTSEVSVEVTLQPSEFPYILVPSLQDAGEEGTFDIHVSGTGVGVVRQLRDMRRLSVKVQ